MDYLQYKTSIEQIFRFFQLQVLNLIINGLPSIREAEITIFEHSAF